MSERFETLREVGIALDGLSSKMSTLQWIIGGIAGLGVACAGFIYVKVDALEEAAARNTAILERIEAQLSEVATDTGAIRETVQTASAEPSGDAFEGWYGVNSSIFEDPQSIIDAVQGSDGWIYLPKEF